jgi:hypothetical protein
VGDRFDMRGALRRPVTRTLPVGDRPVREPGSREVMRQQFRSYVGQLG